VGKACQGGRNQSLENWREDLERRKCFSQTLTFDQPNAHKEGTNTEGKKELCQEKLYKKQVK